MQKSKLINLLRLLSKGQMKRAEQFLLSPYHNTNTTLVKLFQYLKPHHPFFDSPQLDKEVVFKHLRPDTVFEDKKIRTLMSKLVQQLECFISFEELKNEDFIQKQLQIKFYAGKAPYRIFERAIKAQINTLEKQPYRDTEYYYQLHWLNHELFYHPDTQKYTTDVTSISEVMHAVDMSFSLYKLRYASEMLMRPRLISSKDIEIHYLSEVQKIGKEKLSQNTPLIELYLTIIELLKEEIDESLFKECVTSFKQQIGLMNEFDKSKAYTTLINLAVQMLNEGKMEYGLYTFELYKVALVHNLYLYKGKISHTKFINIAVVGAGIQKFDWVKDFIKNHQNDLEEKYKNDALNMAWAFWHYHYARFQKELESYEKALDCLRQIPFSSEIFNLRIRSLQARIFFEFHFLQKNDENVLFYHLQAFKKYLARNLIITKKRKNAYSEFIKFTMKIVKLKTGESTKTTPQLLKKQILSTSNMAMKHWLVQKLEELF